MTELGGLKRAYVLTQVVVLVFGWHEADPRQPERGVRIEVRRHGEPDHRGSPFAAQKVVIDQPLWRADLFDLMSEPPGNFLRAHYHPSFDGLEPSERQWDEALSRDPFGWLAGQLSNLEAIVAGAGAADLIAPEALAADAAALRQVAGEVVAAAEGVSIQVRTGAVS